MSKKVAKKRRLSAKLSKALSVTCFLSAVLFLLSSTFLRQFNNQLSSKIQEINDNVTTINVQNEATSLEISQLASTDRVDQVAANDGLTYNQANIITISDGE